MLYSVDLMDQALSERLNLQIIPGDNQSLVDAPFTAIETVKIELGVVVLLLVNKRTNTLDRIALSRTAPAAGAVGMSNKPFHEIKIPLDTSENLLIKAIETGKRQIVTDWKFLFIPELSEEEARDNQRGSGILVSVVEPFNANNQNGALIFSFLCPHTKLGKEHFDFTAGYAEIAAAFIAEVV